MAAQSHGISCRCTDNNTFNDQPKAWDKEEKQAPLTSRHRTRMRVYLFVCVSVCLCVITGASHWCRVIGRAMVQSHRPSEDARNFNHCCPKFDFCRVIGRVEFEEGLQQMGIELHGQNLAAFMQAFDHNHDGVLASAVLAFWLSTVRLCGCGLSSYAGIDWVVLTELFVGYVGCSDVGFMPLRQSCSIVDRSAAVGRAVFPWRWVLGYYDLAGWGMGLGLL